MEESRTLAALIHDSAAGDEAALRALSKSITRPLFPYLRSRTSRREDALDALQDTLVEVWQSLPRFAYHSDAAFFKFVFTIGKRKLGRIRTMRFREEPLADEHDVADMDALQDTQSALVVSRALRTLSGKDRDIITLRYWSGLPFSDIGQILSMSEGAVRVRHHRALRELEETLTPYVA
jgi:RNA polymerase sigma factor (sigma-70 family)